MKYLSLICVTMIILLSCKKEEISISKDSSSPVFFVKGTIDGAPFELKAGDNNYYAYSDYEQLTINQGPSYILLFNSLMKMNDCELCPNSLKVTISNYKNFTNSIVYDSILDTIQVFQYDTLLNTIIDTSQSPPDTTYIYDSIYLDSTYYVYDTTIISNMNYSIDSLFSNQNQYIYDDSLIYLTNRIRLEWRNSSNILYKSNGSLNINMQASYIDFENKFEYRPNHLNQPTIGVSFRGVCFLEDSQGNIIQMKIDSAVIPFSFPN